MTLGLLLFVCCLALSLTAQAQTVDKREAEITTTQSLEFGAKGTIQIVYSFGTVKVEGWDKEEVELTVKKRTQKKYEPKNIAKAMEGLERFKVTMEPVGETSMMVINTAYPSWTPARMFRGKTNLQLDYLIKVPRQSALLIKHGIGEVQVTNVSGDIEATASIGEISLRLPEGQQYAVDAHVRIGDVSSEFGQVTQRKGVFAVGAKLSGEPAAPTRRIFARIGIGDIQVAKMRAEKSGEQDEKKEAPGRSQEKEVKAPAPQKEFRWQGRLAPNQTIEIQNVKGNVRAEPATGDQVEVIAVKDVRDDPAQVSILVKEHEGGVTLCAIYPNQDPDRPYRCLPNKIGKEQKLSVNIDGAGASLQFKSGGGFSVSAPEARALSGRASLQFESGGGGEIRLLDVPVDFVVRVPKNVGFIGFTVVGKVETRSLASDITAQSVLGDVGIEFPSGGGSRVRAESDLGGIESDWPLTQKSRNNLGQAAQGVIGDGQYNLQLNVATGNILLRRAPFQGKGQQREQSPAIHTYKTVGGESLTFHVFSPPGDGKKRPAVVLFHGGGWVWGSPEITYGSARDYVAGGAVAFAAQYRLANRGTVTPVEQVEDARDAIRWVRKNAEKFGIDPKRVVAHGVSAGGHLATMAAVSSDSTAWPDALVLWSPGLGVTSSSYFKGLLGDRARESDMSPYEQARQGMPPMIIISGVEDAVTPDAEARRYCERVSQKGGRCDIRSYERLGHLLSRKLDPKAQLRGDFDWDPKATSDAENKIWSFLRSLGYLDF
jgi:acetyl esterase/lipase